VANSKSSSVLQVLFFLTLVFCGLPAFAQYRSYIQGVVSGEPGDVQLRFDFLNVFNQGNLGTVDPNVADGTFGRVTSTLNPFDSRKIELGLRVSF
jgi:hypothetical protein